ncbi:MAG: hypothetical protein AB7P23_11930 [Amphiplicatus sp.]
MTTTTIDSMPRAGALRRPRFYLWTAAAMTAVAFIGFAPTFWIPLAQGAPERIAIIAAHAIVFYGWMFLAVYQAWLAAAGNLARHKSIGMIGVSLATSMVIFGMLAGINSGVRATAAGYANAGEAAMILPMAAILIFAVLVTAAIANVNRPEWHKRLMLAATAITLDAAIARLYIAYVMMGGHMPPLQENVGLAGLQGPPPPVGALTPPSLIADLFIVAGMIYDWRTRGKPHPAYWWAAGFAISIQILKAPFSDTALWHAMAKWMISLAG